ncbi:MAG: hypothetical protein NC433_07465 [Clostridiales bacterium]|nr:hypothetical protein [Clostridiales bacterium]
MPLTDMKLKTDLNSFFNAINHKIKTKFSNTVAKTRQNDIPKNIWLDRTARYSRVLIPWKKVKYNNITFEQLQSFSGGVTVEFINEDWFEPTNQTDPVFIQLKTCLGSNNTVSSIISFRSEGGAISSERAQAYFDRFINGTKLTYNNIDLTITKNNYEDYRLTRVSSGQTGNEKWTGFLYYSIRGGIHTNSALMSNTSEYQLFNPSCDYASKLVSYDIFFTLAYFALRSVEIETLAPTLRTQYATVLNALIERLASAYYSSTNYTGNLLVYCNNHPSLQIEKDKLYDPIQVERIYINDFAIDDKSNPRNIDLTHNEAVFHEKYYWDSAKKVILSPARPTNLFWSFHESNMIQQNHTLEEYIKLEIQRVEKRLHITIDQTGENII